MPLLTYIEASQSTLRWIGFVAFVILWNQHQLPWWHWLVWVPVIAVGSMFLVIPFVMLIEWRAHVRRQRSRVPRARVHRG